MLCSVVLLALKIIVFQFISLHLMELRSGFEKPDE